MRKLRAAVVGFLVALPAALTLPGSVPVAASMTTCPGTINLNQPFNVSIQGTPDNNGGNYNVVINGSGFPTLSNFQNNGVTVYFPDGNGNQTVVGNVTSNNTGSSITVTAPPGGYSGRIEVCLGGDSYQAQTQRYSYVPEVHSVPSSASEGSTITLGGKFVGGQPASVHFSCGTVSAGGTTLTQLTVTVPGYCPGQISVTQNAYDTGDVLNGATSAQSLTIKPVVSGLSTGSTYPGQGVTVSGSGFGGGGSVSVGGAGASISSWSDGSITFVAPDGSEGGSVSVSAPGGSASGGGLSILPHIASISPSAAKDGDSVAINGQDFGSSPGTVSLGGQPLDASNLTLWRMDQVTFNVPAGAVPGQVTVTTADNRQAVNAGNLNLIPVISSVSPGSATPGSYVYISGSSFGANAGSISLAGKNVPAQDVGLWSDTAIAFVVPAGATSGKLIVNSGYGQSVAWGQTFTVPGTSASGSSGGTTSYGNSGTMNVTPNYGFLPLPKGPSPIAFHLTAPSTEVKPGASVDLTASLAINGKPIAGAKITLTIDSAPGSDTALSAPSATTDQNGIAHVTLRTSKKPGQTIVIAHSGAFADQIRVVTLSPTAALGGVPSTIFKTSTLDPHILFPFIGALVLAVMLLLGTVILQFVVHRRARVPAPVPAAVDAVGPVGAVDAVDAEPVAAVEEPATPVAPKPKARKPRARKPKAEPLALDLAAGAEDIAPVIPLRPSDDVEPKITRTRGRAKAEG